MSSPDPAFQPGEIAYLLDADGRLTGPVQILTRSRLPERNGIYWYGVQGAPGNNLYAYNERGDLYQRSERVDSVPSGQLRPAASVPESEALGMQDLRYALAHPHRFIR